MAVYSEVVSDEKIISSLPQGCKNVLIVTCGGCMNESLAYKYETPVFVFNDGVSIPFSSKIKAESISDLLSTHGFNIEIKIIQDGTPMFCILSEDNETDLSDSSFKPDAVLALCCAAGVFGLESRSNIPIISVTVQLGCLAYTYADSKKGRSIIKEKSKVILYDNI